MALRHWLNGLLIMATVGACASDPKPYGAPPDTSDPWQLIRHARGWLHQGRPRGALPSLEKVLSEVERLDHGTTAYVHAKAAVHNELGRVFEMVSELDVAEAQFLKAAEIGQQAPELRPLHFDVSFNLSTVYERKTRLAESCAQLQRTATLWQDLLAQPAEQPAGYGAGGERFLREVAAPRIRARAMRIGCDIHLQE